MRHQKLSIDDKTLRELTSTKSFEEVEKEYNIELPGQPMLKRMGYPKSRYYELFTQKDIVRNKKKVDLFLNEIH